MTTLKVLGQSDERLKQLDQDFGKARKIDVTHAVRLESKRSKTSTDYFIKDLQDDDVIELMFEEDIRRWVTVAEFKREFGENLARGGQSDELIVPSRLPAGGRTRGATTWALKALRVFGFDPAAKTAGLLARTYDQHLMDQPGLYFFSESPNQRGRPVTANQLPSSKPILVFIHGTFSSTTGSFGRLPPDIWDDLRKKYGHSIIGLDHYTLTQSPIQNALELVKNLPEGARLHLVTHSRGGLVGELLCRSGIKNGSKPFDAVDFALEHPEPIRQTLKDLSAELERKKLRIERFVRVACPAGGTTLVSGRLDRWLEIIVNVVGKVSGADAFLPYGIVTDFLLDVKKQGTNPKEVPGLAAMAPTSTLIRMLNRLDITVEAGLSVIAGDVEGAGILGRLGVFFADLFYFEDHDLVVNTRAMYGGTPRHPAVEAQYFFNKGPAVNHLTYFKNEDTAAQLWTALELPPSGLEAHGFKPMSESLRVQAAPAAEITARSYQKRSGIPQPVAFVLPGSMGSHLAVNGDRIWVDSLDLARGGLANLNIEAEGVEAEAPLASAYRGLIDYLSATHEVIPFPYDWRCSVQAEADRFGDTVAAKLKETDQPVRIVAHSMGGLVARAMFGRNREVWETFSQRDGARLVMLGTPNEGSFVIPRLLLAREGILKMLSAVDLVHSQEQLLEIVARFPGVLELLPVDNSDWDFFKPETWDRLANADGNGWVKPAGKDLQQARKLRDDLKQSPIDSKCMVYVAGCAPGTPIDIKILSDGGKKSRVQFIGTDEGDGRVPWRSGPLPDVRTWFMDVKHGDLADHEPAFPAIYDLLQTGHTTILPTTPPRVGRAAARYYDLTDDEPEVFPNQADLEQAALAASPRRLFQPLEIVPVKVSVAHGNLSFCECPVAVGHYEGDVLVSAEWHLNHHLDGRLAVRHRLGLYPGREGTVEVVLNPGKKPGGAIVVGLGKVGELSAKKLNDTFTTALLEYALKVVEGEDTPESGEAERRGPIDFATLLVGTGEGGLSVADSMGAILNSVIRANRALDQMEPPYRVRIDAVQFIELYKDRAVQAVRELKPFKDQPEFQTELLLQSLQGGRRRMFYSEPGGWWTRMHIRSGHGDSLIFTTHTGRARAEESSLAVQRGNIDRFIAQSVNSPNWDRRMAAAMFELLIPNRLKTFSPDLRHIVLVLDKQSARYPWELIHDRRAGYDRPMVVEVGMIRQLSTGTFREQVVDVSNRNVLVVGDPVNTPDGFAPLPGAEQEARLVADKLGHDFNVDAEIRTGATSIITSLLSADYRVLHLAGHGVYREPRAGSENDQGEEAFTGMVLGDGVFLTAVEIDQMVQVPELVFVNCCFLGVIGDAVENGEKASKEERYPRHKFAASLAEQLIDMGVRAVVVAGWAVDDSAALTFAEEFYDWMLRGVSFGAAVQLARKETYELHGDRTNTWGAYQCYGDPSYSLMKSGTSAPDDQMQRFVDREEAIVEIDNLTEDAKTASARRISTLRAHLTDIYAHIERTQPSWLNDAVLNEALGRAYGEVDQFEQAVECYEKAKKSNKATASIKAAEQLANLRARWAVQLAEQGAQGLAIESIETSINELEGLNDLFSETSERLSLIGSAYKRLAQISSGPERDDALEKTFSFYTAAWELAPDNPYPLTNLLVAQALRYWTGSLKRKPNVKQKLETALSLTEERKKKLSQDFWAAIGVADVRLAQYLFDGALEPYKEALVNQYSTAWKQYGSPRELRSVVEHLGFIIAVLKPDTYRAVYDTDKRGANRSALYDVLDQFIWPKLAPLIE